MTSALPAIDEAPADPPALVSSLYVAVRLRMNARLGGGARVSPISGFCSGISNEAASFIVLVSQISAVLSVVYRNIFASKSKSRTSTTQ
jgi:hypothetical protein